MKSNKKYLDYVIYDLEDNYIISGTIKEIAYYFNRTYNSMRCSIWRNLVGIRKSLIINGIHYKVYKMED